MMNPGLTIRALPLLLLAGPAGGGCSIGPSPSDYALAVEPSGRLVDVQARSVRLVGELLAVEDSSLLVLGAEPSEGETTQEEPAVVRVPFGEIQRVAEVEDGEVGRTILRGGTPATEERLRLLSRFPQGLDEPLLRRLLRLHDQTEPRTIR